MIIFTGLPLEPNTNYEWMYKSFQAKQNTPNTLCFLLQVRGYSGTAGNRMSTYCFLGKIAIIYIYLNSLISQHNGKKFTTKDQDNDTYGSNNCAVMYSSGWWFGSCFDSNLNGRNIKSPVHSWNGII